MCDRRRHPARRSCRAAGPALAAALALLFVPPLAAAPPASGAEEARPSDPRALLLRADRVRTAWSEARLVLRIVTTRPGAPEQRGDFEVLVKGQKARISFLDPADAGKALYVSGEDAWLVLPTARNPIRIPRAYRLTGGFSVGDVAFTRFAEDYDALWERSDVLDGRACDVLRLMERRDRHPPFPVLRVWIDRKEGLTRKIVFLLPSGKTAREATFDAYATLGGALSVKRMTIVDTLRPGTTTVEYLEGERKSLPDSLFDPKGARKAPEAGEGKAPPAHAR